jgi:hypothetical protein
MGGVHEEHVAATGDGRVQGGLEFGVEKLALDRDVFGQ